MRNAVLALTLAAAGRVNEATKRIAKVRAGKMRGRVRRTIERAERTLKDIPRG